MSVQNNPQESLEHSENPVEAAIDEGWNEINILNYLSRANQSEVTASEIDDETDFWQEQYNMEEEEAGTYAAAFLSYSEGRDTEPGYDEREEFKRMVETWSDEETEISF